MNRLRNRLILVFLAATLPPLALTLWTGLSLLGYKLTPLLTQVSQLSSSLVTTGRELYQQSREALKRDAAEGQGDMPYPPDYPKMPGEPKRVQPSRDRNRPRQ